MLILLLLIPTLARAEVVKLSEVASKIPELNTGVVYSIIENKVNAMATFKVAEVGPVNFNAGYIGDSDSVDHQAAVTASLNLLNLGDVVKFPILDKIVFEPTIALGVGHINFKEMTDAEYDIAVGATFLSLKW